MLLLKQQQQPPQQQPSLISFFACLVDPSGLASGGPKFIKPHNLFVPPSTSSLCDKKVSSDEGSNGDELDLKHISGDWRCVVQVVR